VLLAGWAGLAGLLGSTRLDTLASLGPLVLNIGGALITIAVLGANRRVLAPSWRRPFDALAVAALCVVVLFLPAATALGMEHILHTAVVLGAVITLTRAADGARRWGPPWLPFALLGLATLLRFETVFVTAGLVAAELARLLPDWRDPGRQLTWPGQLRRAGLVAASSAVPLAVFAVANRAMGQGWLPNSVLSKGQTTSGEGNLDWESILDRLTQDPMLALGVLAVAAVLVLDWRRPRSSTFPAIVGVVAAAGHLVFAQIGWYDRYQVYLIALVAFTLLTAAGDHLPADRRPPARSAAVPLLVALVLLVSATRLELTSDVPSAIADTYQQRYQAALFLERSYDGLPVATSELGYISLAHDGPLTDMLGLGDPRGAARHRPAPAGELLVRAGPGARLRRGSDAADRARPGEPTGVDAGRRAAPRRHPSRRARPDAAVLGHQPAGHRPSGRAPGGLRAPAPGGLLAHPAARCAGT
jgi:hypothetical protein